MDQGKPDEAAACYQRALKLKTDYVEAHNNLGNVFNRRGELDKATACYRRALQLNPDYAPGTIDWDSSTRSVGT